MKIVDLSGICFECDVSLQKIESICIETEINRHGICRIKGVVDRKYYEENPEFMAHACSFRIVYRSAQNQEVLFSGFIQEAECYTEAGLHMASITGVSNSKKLDFERKSASYQDVSMNFEELFKRIAEPDGRILLSENREKITGRPFIQYNMTDWEFIREMADTLSMPVIPSCSGDSADILIGAQEQGAVSLSSVLHKQIVSYPGMARRYGGVASDFICCEVEVCDYLRLGERISLDGAEWVIVRAQTVSKQGFITHTYRLMQERGISYFCRGEHRNRNYALPGRVLSAEGNTVRIHLDIDEEQEEGKAYPYEYYPASGNVMYAMPEAGSKVMLSVTEHFPGYGIVTDCMPDPAGGRNYRQRRLDTAEGKRIFLGETGAALGSGNNGKKAVSLADSKEIGISSDRSVRMRADGTIRFRASGGINASTGAMLSIEQSGTINGIVFSGNEIVHTASMHTCSSGPQVSKEPEEQAAPPDFSAMELANALFGMFAQEPGDAAQRALMGAQPAAGSPDAEKWKSSGRGYGCG